MRRAAVDIRLRIVVGGKDVYAHLGHIPEASVAASPTPMENHVRAAVGHMLDDMFARAAWCERCERPLPARPDDETVAMWCEDCHAEVREERAASVREEIKQHDW